MDLSANEMPAWFYKALMVVATAIWGLGTVVVKSTVEDLTPSWIVGIRFLAAGLLLGVLMLPTFMRRFSISHLKAGIVLGILLFFSYWTNTLGLTDTTASNSAFLTTFYVIIIPFLNWAITKRCPTHFSIIAAILCLTGLGFVAYGGSSDFSLRFGDLVTLGSALFLSLHVIATTQMAQGHSIIVLTIVQFIVAGLLGILFGVMAEPVPSFSSFSAETWASLAYLAVFASCLALLLQNLGVAHTNPVQASLFLSLESVFGVLFAVILLGEMPSSAAYIGFMLIFAGIMFSEYIPLKLSSHRKRSKHLAGKDKIAAAEESAAADVLASLEESDASMR